MPNEIKGTTDRPEINEFGIIVPSTPALDKVNNILLASPDNVIDPNSPLYQQALTEYNDVRKKGSTKRLAIPKGFCGYLDPVTGETRVTSDSLSYPPQGQTLITTITANVSSISVDPIGYDVDSCLQHGLPGSKEYSECLKIETDPAALLKLSGINWAGIGASEDQVIASGGDTNEIASISRKWVRDGFWDVGHLQTTIIYNDGTSEVKDTFPQGASTSFANLYEGIIDVPENIIDFF